MSKPKIIKGNSLVKLNLVIYESTTHLFASMLNPTMRGPNFKFTAKQLSEMSYSFGFVASGYSSNDKVKQFEFSNEIPITEYWKSLASNVAERLIESSGIKEDGTWCY